MLLTTYKEANELQSSCISLSTATINTCSYTTRVMWQTKCELVTCISRVACVLAISHAHAKIACNSVCTHKFFKFFMRYMCKHTRVPACVCKV